MTVFIDPPTWPAHGTVFSHLISDASLDELHRLAEAAGVSRHAFDQDHYDVPAHKYEDLRRLGAVAVSGGELTRILLRCGLRIPASQRPEKLRPNLLRAWHRLGAAVAPAEFKRQWTQLGEELVDRWSERHRHYHSMMHLHAVLRSVGELDRAGELGFGQRPVVALAAWFHDAVYSGIPGEDEAASAALAESELGYLLPPELVEETSRLVLVTATHDPEPADSNGAVLVDADLEVLAQSPERYARYTQTVRVEYQHVSDADFRRGRAQVLDRLLAKPTLFHTATGRHRWEQAARMNLEAELELLTR